MFLLKGFVLLQKVIEIFSFKLIFEDSAPLAQGNSYQNKACSAQQHQDFCALVAK